MQRQRLLLPQILQKWQPLKLLVNISPSTRVIHYTVDHDIFACNILLVNFLRSLNFHHQTSATKISIGWCMLHKYFACLIYVGKGCQWKIFNDENFVIYGSYYNYVAAAFLNRIITIILLIMTWSTTWNLSCNFVTGK